AVCARVRAQRLVAGMVTVRVVQGFEVVEVAVREGIGFARVLRDSIRPNDIAARYGGEEFVIVLPGCGKDVAVGVASRIRPPGDAPRVGDLRNAGADRPAHGPVESTKPRAPCARSPPRG